MNNKFSCWICALVAGLVLWLPAAGAADVAAGSGLGLEQAGVAAVVSYLVWTGVNEAYLIRVWSTCTDLNFAHRIGVTSTGHTVSRLESIRVGRQRCPIEDIRPIDVHGYKADRALAHEQPTPQS